MRNNADRKREGALVFLAIAAFAAVLVMLAGCNRESTPKVEAPTVYLPHQAWLAKTCDHGRAIYHDTGSGGGVAVIDNAPERKQ